MNNDQDNEGFLGEIISSVQEAAVDSDPYADPETPRDSWWMRWLKFISIVLIPATVFGTAFLFAMYFTNPRAGSSYDRTASKEAIKNDTTDAMKQRFVIGALLGGGLGAVYVIRCIIRQTDP